MPWRLLTRAGHVVRFATEHGGAPPAADPRLLDGVIFGQLGADRRAEGVLRASCTPTPSSARRSRGPTSSRTTFDGLILPGGHAPGMRQYLGSELLRDKVARVLGARPAGRRDLPRRAGARAHDRSRDRSQPALRAPHDVPAEVHGALRVPRDRVAARALLPHLSRVRRGRGTRRVARPGATSCAARACCRSAAPTTDDGPAFVVEDGSYVSARWPGDAYLFAKRFADRLGS